MKSAFFAIITGAALIATGPLHAEGQNSELVTVGSDKFLRWHGQSGRTYFVQISDPNDHLNKWIWAPIIETGNDEDISYEVDGTASNGFFRLWFSDQSTNDPDGDDFDGDGLGNLAEVSLHQTNPLKADSDGDGMPDGWEILHDFDPTDTSDATLDSDHDGLSNQREYELGTDPANPDSDGDGITDGGEEDEGTNPADPLSHPAAEWVVLTGDLEENLVAVKSRVVTIPAGQKRLILIGVASEEYPFYTGDQSQFNDTLSWSVAPSNGSPMTGNIDVNSRHAQWVAADDQGQELHGFYPAHIENGIIVSAPANASIAIVVDLTAVNIGDSILPSTVMIGFPPFDSAPEVVAVNSNFDEGRTEPVTGFAIPDCDDIPGVDPVTGAGNTLIALEAVRPRLDGTYTQNQRVTNNLHEGWFGVKPETLDDVFWDGAIITIRKVVKIDDQTGYPESGQVRFYSKWGEGDFQYYGIEPYALDTLAAANLAQAGINGVPGESVYGLASNIPANSKFYMEGVRPGKITLEWRYQKGNLDFKQEQTFHVETRQSVAAWQEEVRYQIRLQTKAKTGNEVDVALYHPGNGFRNTSASSPPENDNVARVKAIYYYYQQLFNQMPEKFMWARMAKTAAAPIYAGMSDLTSWWQAQQVPGVGGADGGIGTKILINGLLLGGQKAIFTDKAWAHRAYMASGKWALEWVESQTFGNPPTDFEAWSTLNASIFEENQDGINTANQNLLLREQRDVVQRYYFDYTTNIFMKQPPLQSWIGAVAVAENSQGLVNVGEWLSANSNKNPMPGGPKFRDVVPGGRSDNYQNRWEWTANAANGMIPIWTGDATDASAPKFDAGHRLSENGKTMYSASAAYSFDVGGLPIE